MLFFLSKVQSLKCKLSFSFGSVPIIVIPLYLSFHLCASLSNFLMLNKTYGFSNTADSDFFQKMNQHTILKNS